MKFDLDRYNRVVWALLGTLALVGLTLLLVTGLTSLWPSRGLAGTLPAQPSPERQDAAAHSPALRLGLPEQVQGTDVVLIPVEALVEGKRGGGGGFGSYAKGEPGGPLFNMVFLNTRTGVSQALLNSKALITRYEMLEERPGDAPRAAALVLRMITADTNRNGRLDDDDEEKVYLCDPTGRGLREITPPDSACERWHFESSKRTLYLLTRPRGQATERGPRDVFAVSLDGNQPAQPVLSKDRMNELRTILQR